MFTKLTARTMVLATRIRRRSRQHDRDAGYSTEAIAVTAFLVALALAALAILGPKVLDKIESITL